MAYFFEIVVFLASAVFAVVFLARWYRPIAGAWPAGRARAARWVLGLLPLLALAMIVYTLVALASFDVSGDFFYMLLYIALGFVWVHFGMRLVFALFDISWRDDALELANPAAIVPVAAAYLGLALIYCGANIGDGPGWWCVVFAGALGVGAWLGLGAALNALGGLFERVTIGRDFAAGVRFGGYLLASAVILARASGGDWTSFGMTIVEFLDGWPVLLLAVLALLVELIFAQWAERRPGQSRGSRLAVSVVAGVFYIVAAVVFVIEMAPLPQNPVYGLIR